MRKLIYPIILLFVTSQFSILQAQIKVSDNGNVGIKYDGTPLSKMVLNHIGNSDYEAYFYNPTKSYGGGLFILSEASTGTHVVSLNGYIYSGSGYGYGVKATAYNSTPSSSGRAYGIQAYAGNATSGYNYAVYGYLLGSSYGAAVFGTVNGLGDVGLPAQFAGYFRGNVKCENIMYAASFQTISDEKFKTNIIDLDPDEVLYNITRINPKKYNLKQFEIIQESADTISITKYYNESDQLFTKAKYGVIAQELHEIYPDLVYQDNEGNLSVDYIGLIPILIKAIQAQQNKIEDLEKIIIAISNNK